MLIRSNLHVKVYLFMVQAKIITLFQSTDFIKYFEVVGIQSTPAIQYSQNPKPLHNKRLYEKIAAT